MKEWFRGVAVFAIVAGCTVSFGSVSAAPARSEAGGNAVWSSGLMALVPLSNAGRADAWSAPLAAGQARVPAPGPVGEDGGSAIHTIAALAPAPCGYGGEASAAGLTDGCAGAGAGTPQHTTMLSSYGSHRPPWDVAGVDYYVGATPNATLTDWKSLNVPGIDISGNYIRCDGTYATHPTSGTVTLASVDFTTHGGTYIYVPSGGCSGLIIRNSKFGTAAGETGCSMSPYYAIQSQNPGAAVTVSFSTFDMTKCGIGQAAVIYSQGNTVLHYNYFGHLQGQVLQAPSGQYSIDYRFNLIEDCCYYAGNHMNFQEFGGKVASTKDLVAFNTTYQYEQTPDGGEEFQFYGNSGGSQTQAMLMNNTIITTNTGTCLTKMTNCVASYAIHGNGSYSPTTSLAGPAYNMNNYFDPRGMIGPYYPNSMTGWKSSGNVNMVTGATITP